MSLHGVAPRSTGQALVEFALVIPVFLLVLFGLIDMGRYVFLNSAVSQAAREAARVASVEAYWMGSGDPTCNTSGGPTCPGDLGALRADILDGANRMVTPFQAISESNLYTSCGVTPPTGSWTTKSCSNRTPSSSSVSIRVTTVFTPLTPVIGQMLGSVDVSGSATMVIN
jgi:TadE-like protein